MRGGQGEDYLLKQLAEGSAVAFEALYYRYYQPVRDNIFRITRNEEATDDILQEVFVRLWEKREKLVSYEKISGWLFVVSYNRALNHLRQTSAQKISHQSIEAIAAADWSVEGSLLEQQLTLLEEAIAQLPPQRRKVFELCRLQGFTYDQTARELSISKNTVKDHLAHATTTIRSHIQLHTNETQGLATLAFFLMAVAAPGT